MRIIAGKLKGRRLGAPQGKGTRPTTDKVREAVFNLLSARISLEGTAILDLFCGTGAFGLEAISRGADSVVFVDLAPTALRSASVNAEELGVKTQCRFHRRDALRYLKKSSTPSFDVIFADPPYDWTGMQAIPQLAVALLKPGGLVVLEHDRRLSFESDDLWVESRSYGRTIVTIFQASPH